jgi:hypothetical protein
METNPVLFRDLTYIFLAALAGGWLAWRLTLVGGPMGILFIIGFAMAVGESGVWSMREDQHRDQTK